MSQQKRFPVVLLWHMHQPNYRDALSGEYYLPWTYLHAIKDYVDMAAHLEANPEARAVVNFTPVLIEQLQEIAARTTEHLQRGVALPDPVLSVLSAAPLPQSPVPRLKLLRACLRAHRTHLINRYPAYASLATLAAHFATTENVGYASDQYLRDLGVWFHIAWLGETVKRSDLRVATLIERERDYTPQHCRMLLELIGELLVGVLPRYRQLHERGQVELSVTPYAHPILPLLLDFYAAREAQPDVQLPEASHYPGGAERAAWHMAEALRVFESAFGAAPPGCWPSEGAISAGALDLIAAQGFRWVASGGNVLQSCLRHATPDAMASWRSYQRPGQSMRCVFRHDELSDLIGFSYSTWHGDDAVRHFVSEIERQVEQAQSPEAAGNTGVPPSHLLIALDGENAWEHYPFNAFYFLQGLYAALAAHPRLQLTTLSELVSRAPLSATLDHVVAGSWVHGTLATWIGDRDKNRGWDLLVAAKQAVDKALASGRFTPEQAARIGRQLAQCESSDWFWWFGDYNPAESVRDFDELFRHQLHSLYELLGMPSPESLSQPISTGHGAPEGGGVMRRAGE
jgi:alpha-amylase/alpha-mannosidase (GH57 family)